MNAVEMEKVGDGGVFGAEFMQDVTATRYGCSDPCGDHHEMLWQIYVLTRGEIDWL